MKGCRDYHFCGEDSVESPSLVYYLDQIGENTDRVIAMAGGAERLWPHVKTHKMAAMVRMQIARGIRRFKCATIAEAEMCAREGAADVLVSYPLVGPAVAHFLRLRQGYARTNFWATGDDLGQLENLGKNVCAKPLDTLIDVNLGMNRTGVSLDALGDFCLAADGIEGLRVMGLHCYDGHLDIGDIGKRRVEVSRELEKVWAVKAFLEKHGKGIPVLVMGGTPTFPLHREMPGVYLSPGTIFVNDFGYATKFRDLPFMAGAAILTRVISHPAPGLFTLDTGYKAISADKTDRGVIADLPAAKPVAHSEEHWVWSAEGGALPPIGRVVYLIPGHICPTTALYPGAHVVSAGRLVAYWEVTARNRFLSPQP